MSTKIEPIIARMAVAAPAGASGEFCVMPGGRHRINPTQGGQGIGVDLLVDAETARALDRQLALVKSRAGHRPYFDFNHEDGEASFWPERFFWRNGPDELNARGGVWVRGEWSARGRAAVEGKAYRVFSPVFYVDDVRGQPARVVCNPDARLNMGGLVNDPAFQEMPPLWAKQKDLTEGNKGNEGREKARVGEKGWKGKISDLKLQKNFPGAGAPGGAGAESSDQQIQNAEYKMQNRKVSSMSDQEIAELQAKNSELEQRNNAVERENSALAKRLEAADQALAANRRNKAEAAVKAAVGRGALPARDQALLAKWTKWCAESPEMIEALDRLEGHPALDPNRLAPSGLEAGGRSLQARPGPQLVAKAFLDAEAGNRNIEGLDALAAKRRGEIARELAAIYRHEIRGNKDFLDMPLMAATTGDSVGTLAGVLVAQRTLELFRYEFPVLSMVTTDFSDLPGLYNQTENTRIIVAPAVQEYVATVGADGRPAGWSTVSPAQTTDVPITLDKHVGVPIVFDANVLGSTVRRLFDEQAPAAMYSLAKYFVDKIYALYTAANYNAYAAVVAGKVPVAYATYPLALADVGRSALIEIGTAFSNNEVPLPNRFVLLNSAYYGKLSNDPSLVTFFAGQQAPEIVTDLQLPRLARFKPIEAPNFPGSDYRVGMALHKAGTVIKARLPNDYTTVFGAGSSYGIVTTITDPDIGLSVMLVQYVSHKEAYAEWRIQVMLGAAKGDKRGGLLITSQ